MPKIRKKPENKKENAGIIPMIIKSKNKANDISMIFFMFKSITKLII